MPQSFVFGTASAAYPIEGAVAENGRGPSVWDTFSHTPGKTVNGDTGDVTCDHFHRFAEDFALMQELGTSSYRFSIAWPRIQPSGRGPANKQGLDFYDRLIDSMLEHGQKPMATLYQWDLPQALQEDGGWLNRGTVEAFAEYAGIVGEAFADRVEHWVPIGAPNVQTVRGYGVGTHAPGMTLSYDCAWVGHHLLLGHGRAAIELRRHGAQSVGCANNHAPIWPYSDKPEDTGASKLFDAIWNGAFIEPMLLGRYPVDLQPLMEELIGPGDMATIRQPLDFYGVNYSSPIRVGAAPEDHDLPFIQYDVLGYPTTDVGWPVVPDALREWLIMFRARFRAALPPIFITESGCAFHDQPGTDGVIDDKRRSDYHAAHLRAVAEAVQRGVDIRAYYAWSLTDTFEWAEGFSQRYGFVRVDFETQQRTRKNSFHWYADTIAAHATGGGDEEGRR